MPKEIETWYAEVLKSRHITSAIRSDLQKIDRLYSTLARLKFELYNLRKEADVEYTAVIYLFIFFCFINARVVGLFS